jgi:hypothetical protein
MSEHMVRGALSDAALSRAPDLFDLSDASVVSELLQNARRAGAANLSVDASADGGDGIAWVSFHDDGHGVRDFGDLVAFGRSNWGAEVADREDTAGMGVFCLASRGCTVQSGRTSVRITTEVFAGREDATLEEAEPIRGTRVTFALRQGGRGPAHDITAFGEALRREAVFCPIDVTLRGKRVERMGFLDGAVHVEDAPGTAVGVFDRAAWQERASKYRFRTGWRSRNEGRGDPNQMTVNFWGHAAMTPALLRIPNGDDELTVAWDVRGRTPLRLVLPTRDLVIEDEAWHALARGGIAAMLRYVAGLGEHRVPMALVEWARKEGIAVRDPLFQMERWVGRPRSATWAFASPPPDKRFDARSGLASGEPGSWIIGPVGWPCRAVHALLAASAASRSTRAVVAPDDSLDGLEGYDVLDRVAAVHLRIVLQDGSEADALDFQDGDGCDWPELEDLLDDAEEGRVTSITATVEVEDAMGVVRVEFTADILVAILEWDDMVPWGSEGYRLLISEGMTLHGAKRAARVVAAAHVATLDMVDGFEDIEAVRRRAEKDTHRRIALACPGGEERILAEAAKVAATLAAGPKLFGDAECPVATLLIERIDEEGAQGDDELSVRVRATSTGGRTAIVEF